MMSLHAAASRERPVAGVVGFSGMVAGGRLRPGQRIAVLPSGAQSTVERIVTYDGDLECAVAGQSVTVTLADAIDVSRGDVIADAQAPPRVGEQFEATVVWMAEEPLLQGRSYVIQVGTTEAVATIAPLKYKLDVDSHDHLAAEQLELNEIGVCELELDRPIAFDPYAESRDMGCFVLIDRLTNQTLAGVMLNFELRRSRNVQPQPLTVDKDLRAESMHQTPCVLWLTGLSGAGKSTIANIVAADRQRICRLSLCLAGICI